MSTKTSTETAAPASVTIGIKTDDPVEIPLPQRIERPERRLLLIDGHSLAFRAFFALSRAAEYGSGPSFVTSDGTHTCLLYTSPSPRDRQKSRMPSSA